MRLYSKVAEQDLVKLLKLAEQEKNQQAEKTKNTTLKQTHDIKLAENLSPTTNILDEVKESTQEIGGVIKKQIPKTKHLNWLLKILNPINQLKIMKV